jgi:flagellar biosynthesis protein FlhF
MRVKRYVVDSMPDALQQIRTDLGKDAVILNTKEIRSGGFLGLFSKKKIEVIAATDALSKSDSRSKAPVPAARTANSSMSGSAASVALMEQPELSNEQKAANILESIGRLSNQRENHPAEAIAMPKPVIPAGQGAALYGARSSAPSAAAASVSPPVAKPVLAPQPQPAASADDPVLSELRVMKQLMQKLSSGTVVQQEPDPILAKLEDRLLEQEVKPEIVADLLNTIEEQAAETGEVITHEFADMIAKDQLRILMGANTRKPLQPETKIAHFVGPTGVGKTTTIAKLAAEQVLKHRRKVGFITSDTYRIAAVDQLKTYATILGVPLEVVFSPLDLKKAFENLQDRDIIFMDTAGRNFRNEMYVSELNALLNAGAKSETYLVLSLTMKYKDMKAVADNFSRFKLDKVLFTKRDETDTFGSVVNLLQEFPLELSYVTTGQNVPDDFGIASENDIIGLILGEQSDE